MRILALFLIAASAAPVLAESTITVAGHTRFPSVDVRTADLDLASADGQRRLDDRLWRAARQVCTMTAMRDLAESRLADRCRADSLARARAARGAVIAD